MARYTDESRERVRDAVDFEEVVGARTELKRAGVSRLQGLCPFHDERSPSFGINPVEKVYYCFGCGAGGDVFKFVMETENLSFGEALESLAERYRVPLERESEDPREAERRQKRDRLLALLERTAAYYVRVLWESPDAAHAREYLASRGLEEGALRAYRVGFAPDTWDRVVLGSRKAGYSEGELVSAGLASRSSRGTLIDRFRGRITFPLADERGRVLGFGARAMKPDDKPKYLNTSESDLFHKGRIVYGADMARAAAAKAGRVVLVEGYTDVIALHQAGVPEVVAQMGTALTDAQVDAIARLAPKALFCQDPDRAGQESVAKGIAALRSVNAQRKKHATRGVDFRIVRLPAGEDPADVVQKSGTDEMRALLDKAIAIERFEVERALEQPDTTSDEKLSAVALIIGAMPSGTLQAELVQLVAGHLGMSASLVNEALRAPAPSRPPFTARPRGELRGRGEPGRGGNPPRAGWSRGGAPAAPPAGSPGGGTVQSRPPVVPPLPQVPTAPPAGAVSEDPFSDGPPPPEWDGFSGEDDFDPGAMGSPQDFVAAAADAGAVPPPGAGAPPQHGRSGDAQQGGGAGAQSPQQQGGGAPQHQGWSGDTQPPQPGWSGDAPPPQQQGWSPEWQPQQQGWSREWQPRGGRRDGQRGGRGNYRGGGRDRDRYRRDMPPPEPVDPRAQLARREENERAFLAFCIALPEHGERRLETVDVDDYFSAPATRQAAAFLRGRLRSPTANLPTGDDALARLIAELVITSGQLEATPAKLELEGLQLDLQRVERRIASARVTGATGVGELAKERQTILDEIRRKMT